MKTRVTPRRDEYLEPLCNNPRALKFILRYLIVSAGQQKSPPEPPTADMTNRRVNYNFVVFIYLYNTPFSGRKPMTSPLLSRISQP